MNVPRILPSWLRFQLSSDSTSAAVRNVILNSPLFDIDFYLRENPDIGPDRADPAMHYASFGGVQGRDPGPYFSTNWYLNRYPDVAASGMNALFHYEMHGRGERREIALAHNASDLIYKASERIPKCTKYEYAVELDELASRLLGPALKGYPSATYAKLMILRICNMLMLKHSYYHGHQETLAKPEQILIDPSNTCQLRCPGCVHSPSIKERFDWQRGIMSMSDFDRILNEFGPFALFAAFFNYGEPLINKKTPEMIAKAKGIGLSTTVSSNLSLSFDIDAVVSSGLDYLMMSIDGVSQETLGRAIITLT